MPRPQSGSVDHLKRVFTKTCDNCRYGGVENCHYNGGPVWSTESLPPCKLTCERWYNKTRAQSPQWELIDSVDLPMPDLTPRASNGTRIQGHYSYHERLDGDIKGMLEELREVMGMQYASHVIAYIVPIIHKKLLGPNLKDSQSDKTGP